MPPPRRTPPARRPQVAGLPRHPTPSRPGTDAPLPGSAPAEARSQPRRAVPLAGEPAATGDGEQQRDRVDPDRPAAAAAASRQPPARPRPGATLVALVAAVVIAAGLAVWFHGESYRLRATGSAQNQALVDVTATAQVNGQVGDALETVYSYDFTRLDVNQRAGSEVVTGRFARDYRDLFNQVRELAPPQQAVVSAVVADSAVKVLDGDRAILLVFLNQQGTRGATGEQIGTAARLTVTAERVDGRWKIADVQNR